MSRDKVLGVVVVLQALTLLGQFVGPSSPRAARADINLPNPSERQLEMIDELKQVNARLDRLLGVLQSGDLQVQVKPGAGKAGEEK